MRRHALLDRGGEEAAHPTEDLGALPGTKTARDLLLYLGHPQVALPLVVGERRGGILEKTQHVVLVRLETFQQVARFCAFGTPARPGRWLCRWRALGVARRQAASVTRSPALGLIGAEAVAGGIHRSAHGQQQVMERLGPALVVVFPDRRQFPQVMGIAQDMPAIRVAVVGLPMIMHQHATHEGQYADGIHRLLAALGMRGQPGQGVIGIFEVFVDTIVVCSMTAFVILTSGLWTDAAYQGSSGDLTAAALSTSVPLAALVVALCSFLFGFSTLIGWSYYGEKCVEFMFGSQVIRPYRLLFTAMILIGSIVSVPLVWAIGTLLNGFMAFPNLLAILFLIGTVRRLNASYTDSRSK